MRHMKFTSVRLNVEMVQRGSNSPFDIHYFSLEDLLAAIEVWRGVSPMYEGDDILLARELVLDWSEQMDDPTLGSLTILTTTGIIAYSKSEVKRIDITFRGGVFVE